MTQLPKSLSDDKPPKTSISSIWASLLAQPVRLKISVGGGLCLLILLPVLYFALKGKPTVLVIYGDVDIRDVNLGLRVPGEDRDRGKDKGESVSKGDLVASLDKSIYNDALAIHAADVEVKAAILKDAEVTLKRDEPMVNSGGKADLR